MGSRAPFFPFIVRTDATETKRADFLPLPTPGIFSFFSKRSSELTSGDSAKFAEVGQVRPVQYTCPFIIEEYRLCTVQYRTVL